MGLDLQDTIENALEGAGQPLMVALKPVVKEIARVLDKMKPAFKTLGVALGQGATSFLNIFKKLNILFMIRLPILNSLRFVKLGCAPSETLKQKFFPGLRFYPFFGNSS